MSNYGGNKGQVTLTIEAGEGGKGTATWEEVADAGTADIQSLLTGSVCVENDGRLTFNLEGTSKFSASCMERPGRAC